MEDTLAVMPRKWGLLQLERLWLALEYSTVPLVPKIAAVVVKRSYPSPAFTASSKQRPCKHISNSPCLSYFAAEDVF